MKKQLIVLDIKHKINSFDIINEKCTNKNSEILSLTPYSSYLLESIGQNFITFHDLISIENFRNSCVLIYDLIIDTLSDYEDEFFLLRNIMALIAYEKYIKTIENYIKEKKEEYNIIYITDVNNSKVNFSNLFENKCSLLHDIKYFDDKFIITQKDKDFYRKNQTNILSLIYRKNIIKKIINRVLKRTISYDAIHYDKYFSACAITESIDNRSMEFCKKLMSKVSTGSSYVALYKELFNNYSQQHDSIMNSSMLRNQVFTYISNGIVNIKVKILKKNNEKTVFFQHGSYLYAGEHSTWCEVVPASINFVFNDYTKKLFRSRRAKKVYSVGSLDFNYDIKEKKKKYDYLYITYCTDYGGNRSDMHKKGFISVDGNQSYLRHKAIIKLFGSKFKDKKICIKIQPGIFKGTMLYVPLLELSKEFKNVTIEFTIPVSKLIEKSKYIISDYFSSEFINRELHYKRDIILFQGAPLVLPEEIYDDMDKMFILVDTIDELKAKVENIEKITKNRKRYDDIIEYYSSKKCNTKKVVEEILKHKENN